MPKLALTYPIIRDDYIYKSVETLYKYTKDFLLIVVDQSIKGLDKEWIDKNVHFYIRMKNQGFAKAANEGMIHGLRMQIPYIGVCNDDVEFMYDGWFDGVIEEFETSERIMAINPESPRVPLWGYGRPHEEYIDIVDYKENYTKEDIELLKSGNYQHLLDKYGLEPYDIPERTADGKPDWKGKIYIPVEKRPNQPNQGQPIFPIEKRGVIDGFACWLPIFKKESLLK